MAKTSINGNKKEDVVENLTEESVEIVSIEVSITVIEKKGKRSSRVSKLVPSTIMSADWPDDVLLPHLIPVGKNKEGNLVFKAEWLDIDRLEQYLTNQMQPAIESRHNHSESL